MAKQEGATEKATPKQRKKQREEGNVAKSKEVGMFFNLAAFAFVLIVFGEWFVKGVENLLLLSLDLVGQNVTLQVYLKKMTIESGKLFLFIAAIGLVFQTINQLLQIGFIFSAKIIKPDLKKMNPLNYWKNLFSRRVIVDLVKSLLIFFILGYIVYFVFESRIEEISVGILLSWQESLSLLWDIFKELLIKILIGLLFIAAADFFYQRWEHEESIKMKKQDVKDEFKENNGNPQVKEKQRQMAITLLRKEIKTKVPEASFILTNPTHYSVAIRYKRGDGPPKVLVKGIDHIALYMREVAKENNVPIFEAPPLAREVYNKVGEGEYIPQELYQAVIEIMKALMISGKLKIE